MRTIKPTRKSRLRAIAVATSFVAVVLLAVVLLVAAGLSSVTPPTRFDMAAAQVLKDRVQIPADFMPAFYLYCALLGALALCCTVWCEGARQRLRVAVTLRGPAPAVSR